MLYKNNVMFQRKEISGYLVCKNWAEMGAGRDVEKETNPGKTQTKLQRTTYGTALDC